MKRTIAAMLLMAAMSLLPMAAGATGNPVNDGDEILTVAERMPSFKGNMAMWINQNLRKPGSRDGVDKQGRVVVKLVIEKDGSVSNPVLVRRLSRPYDREALRVVRSMPKWNPAMNNGKPVRCYFTIPVTFPGK